MRLGFACRPESANGHYRVILPMEEMARRGHTVVSPSPALFEEALTGRRVWDLLHAHQYVDESNAEVFERLRELGVAVVWDSDDDLLNTPPIRETRRRLGGRRKLRRLHEQAISLACMVDLVTTTNQHLANRFRDEGVERVAVIPNHISSVPRETRRRRHVGVIIGLVAAVEHTPDVEGLRVARVLRAIQEEHEHVTVVALGVDLKLSQRYLHRPKVQFAQLIETVRDFDIGLAPLVDSPFSRARSDVKLKEYAQAGVPWLASPVGPYVGLGEAQGGLLVSDEDWYDAIDTLVRNPRRRADLTARGRSWAATQTIRQSGSAWERAFREAMAHARGAAPTRTGALLQRTR